MLSESKTDYIHIDMMDGVFVSDISVGLSRLCEVRKPYTLIRQREVRRYPLGIIFCNAAYSHFGMDS
ncbi:MAG: hypothetical protein GDA42_02245 [Ekhidna sp.]|nr:hypothetical protein [Ekhidna sp.]